MKYTRLFQNHTEYEAYTADTTNFILPNVSYCVQEDEAHCTPVPRDYSKEYFTIESLEDGNTISIQNVDCDVLPTFYYSLDNGETWGNVTMTKDGTQNIATIDRGDKILFKSTNANLATKTNQYNKFNGSNDFNVYGNAMSLLFGDDYEDNSVFASNSSNNLVGLFFDATTLIDASNMILPATTLAQSCYQAMFEGCTSLTNVPDLPATTLANSCYYRLFKNCGNLKSVPSDYLPATVLTNNCYQEMFYGCSSLLEIPLLPATILGNWCYADMFEYCTSLAIIPDNMLPATTLKYQCYRYMFRYCTSLNKVPFNLLPATTLETYCYQMMFYGCTSLTTAPELPATTLASACYQYMFWSCSKLNNVKCLATDISATSCTTAWLHRVSASGTFTKAASMNDWTSGSDGIPTNWTVVDAT